MSLAQTVARLSRGLALLAAEAILKRIDDGPRLQQVQVSLLAGETRSRLQRIQDYGFTSVPFPGARAVALFLGGNRDHGLVIATDDGRYRLKALAPGEVALYDDQGRKVHLTRAGVEVEAPDRVRVTAPQVEVAASAKVLLDTPLVEVTGQLRAVGDVTAFDGLANEIGLGQMRDTYNTHTHNENDAGGPTDPPNQQLP